jgi:hypothetical protein
LRVIRREAAGQPELGGDTAAALLGGRSGGGLGGVLARGERGAFAGLGGCGGGFERFQGADPLDAGGLVDALVSRPSAAIMLATCRSLIRPILCV